VCTLLLDGEVIIIRVHNEVLALLLKDCIQPLTRLLPQLCLLGLELLLRPDLVLQEAGSEMQVSACRHCLSWQLCCLLQK
jgi:hypothetical protein